MSLMTPKDLLISNDFRNKAQEARITEYLNAALDGLKLAPEQRRVENLFLVKAKESDADVIKYLMLKAGYGNVRVSTRQAEMNSRDVYLSFAIPPQED